MGGLESGYPGLTSTAFLIAHYIPKCKIYCEPLAGLGRVAKHVEAEKYILNDMSEYAVKHLRSSFPTALVTQEDFAKAIERYDTKETFFFIDPPWGKTDYVNNAKTFCDRGVGDYYSELKIITKKIKGDWIIAGRAEGGARSTLSVYFADSPTKVIQSPKKINGHRAKVKLVSNNPFKIQVNTLEKFVST